MRRGEVFWADFEAPIGRRPVLVVTRDSAIGLLQGIIVAPITRTIRGIPSEVPLGRPEGLREPSVANCDDLFTASKRVLDPVGAGVLSPQRVPELDRALRFALGIVY